MKYTLLTTILLVNISFIFGQENKESTLLSAGGKAQLYYVELSAAGGNVFEMGSYLDKAGSGYSIKSVDTLTRQPDQSGTTYFGKKTKIWNENGKLYLEIQSKKTSKYKLESEINAATVNTNLNNAYFLDNFIALSDDLNKSYPLNHVSFRDGFNSWNSLENKGAPYAEFKSYADARLRELKDSITREQEKYVSLKNSIFQNIKTIEYSALKDSLDKFPSASNPSSKYFGTVINEVAKENPDYFFRLAEDYPDKRSAIFNAVENDKQVIAGLKSVENHKDAKREFFRSKKFDKHMPIRIIVTTLVAVGIIILVL